MSQKTKGPNFNLLGTAVAVVSYFIIKYGIAARYYDLGELNFGYSLVLIFACMFFGRAVQAAVEERRNKNS